jgi:hypothetical protein
MVSYLPADEMSVYAETKLRHLWWEISPVW